MKWNLVGFVLVVASLVSACGNSNCQPGYNSPNCSYQGGYNTYPGQYQQYPTTYGQTPYGNNGGYTTPYGNPYNRPY